MYELINVSGNSYYIQSPAKIGLIKTSDTDVVLIDSGNDKDAGKKVLRILEEKGWSLKAIYNTHSHADHIGGGRFLQDKTGCKIYAKGIECDFINHTVLEPTYLYGGFAPRDLRHKFLLAQESKAEPLTDKVLPDGFEIIELGGHFFDMVGFKTADDVIYLADCLSSKATLDKYGIGVIYDVAKYIETLEMVKSLKAKMFVPSHAEAAEDISELCQYNIDKTQEVAENILGICKEPITFEALLQKLFDKYSLTMTFEQHSLVGSTVRSYLSYLKDSGKIDVEFQNNLMLWRSI